MMSRKCLSPALNLSIATRDAGGHAGGTFETHLRSSADQSSPPRAPCEGEGKKLINASKMRRIPHAGCGETIQRVRLEKSDICRASSFV